MRVNGVRRAPNSKGTKEATRQSDGRCRGAAMFFTRKKDKDVEAPVVAKKPPVAPRRGAAAPFQRRDDEPPPPQPPPPVTAKPPVPARPFGE